MTQGTIDWNADAKPSTWPKDGRHTLPRVSQEAFDQYHADNPAVYQKLLEFAMQAKRAGAKHIGIGMLYERLRWYTAVEARNDEFKVNNNYRAFYARKLMTEHPELDGMFELRYSVADESK